MNLAKILYMTLIVLLLAGCGDNDAAKLLVEGDQYRSHENYSGAIVIYKTILDEHPNDIHARIGLAKSYLATGKLDQARKNYEKYLLQNPYDKEVHYDLARLERFSKDRAKALEYIASYCAEHPESLDGAVLHGQLQLEDGQDAKAEEWFRKGLAIAPESSAARLGLAHVYRSRQQLDEVDGIIAEILEKEPTNREALYLLADRKREQGDIKAYREIFVRISEAHPNDAYAKYMKAHAMLEAEDFGKAWEIAQELKATAPNSGLGQKVTGLSMYIQKEYKEAINAFHSAISIRPDAEAYFFLGLSYYALGDLETAISQFRQAADRADYIKAREMISMILLRQNRLDESVSEARKVIDEDDKNLVARMTLGDALTLKGDATGAMEQYKAVAEGSPNDSSTYLKMGALHYSLGQMDQAESALNKAVSASPESIRPVVVLFAFYMKNGETDLARRTLEDGMTGEKVDSVLYYLLAQVNLTDNNIEAAKESLAQAKASDPANPDPYITLAAMSLAERKPEAALEEYNAILAQRQDFARAWLGKALVLQLLKRPDEAEASYREALKTKSPEAYLAYASNLMRQGKPEEALTIVEQGRSELPFIPDVERLRAQILLSMKRYDDVLSLCNELEKRNQSAALGLRTRTYMLKGDFDKAVVSARQIIDFFPDQPVGYLNLAEIYANMGDRTSQMATLEEGLRRCDSNSTILVAMGTTHLGRGEIKKALTYIDAAIKRDDKNFVAQTIRGNIQTLLGDETEAVDCYKKALQLSERYVPALNNLAMIYLRSDRTRMEALRLGYTAYMQRPGDPAVLDTFGYALAVNGRSDEAVQVLQRALELAGENPDIEYHLGYAYQRSGDNDKAKPLLEKVANCENCESADEARKLLASISGE